MKLSIIIGIVIIAVLIAGGIFLMSEKKENSNNQITKTETINPPTEAGVNPETGEKLYRIEISNFAFSPKEIRIKKGDTIIWTNKDSVRHTITSDSGSELSSSLLENNEQYSHTFTQSGSFDYHCTPHPYMKAKVVVE